MHHKLCEIIQNFVEFNMCIRATNWITTTKIGMATTKKKFYWKFTKDFAQLIQNLVFPVLHTNKKKAIFPPSNKNKNLHVYENPIHFHTSNCIIIELFVIFLSLLTIFQTACRNTNGIICSLYFLL